MSEPVRLLMITHNYPRFEGDFAGVFIALLARKLIDHNITPIVLAPHDPGAKELEELNGVRVYRFRYAPDDREENLAYKGSMHKLVLGSVSGVFRFSSFLSHFRKAAFDIIDKEKIDIVAGHWLIPAGLVMKSIMRETSLPMIMSSHGTDIRLMTRYFRVTYRYLKNFCLNLRRWTVVSTFLRDAIIDLDPRLAGTLEVLPLPHDETVFYRDESVARQDNLVVAITRFTEQKRVDYLIRAFALVSEQHPDARLHLYGTGPLKARIEQLVHKFGIEKAVSIHDPVPQEDLREVYNQASIVVLNSYQDGFGLALSEAMMCGAATIGTDSGGITDIISHEDRGLLVKLDNSADLAEAMSQLLSDPALRRRLADNGHRFATETYTSSRQAERYAEIIHQAVKSSR